LGFFDKLNKFISSIGLDKNKLSNSTKAKPKIRKKTIESASSKLKQGVASLGVDISPVLNDPQIKRVLVAHVKKTCNEIETIPKQYRDKVAKAILDNFYGKLPDGRSLLVQLQSVCQMSQQEASLIARDQSSKLAARLDQARQEAIGIEEYIWCTTIGRCNHSERNGKKFRWDSPPPDGHPGQPYLCACTAKAVVDINKITRAARNKK
jgi:SPP1 gp7 family putative phage head morphogenesis protein